jgi:Arc/MetJ-type ribon-helix-helix transcriptional regulator
MRLDEKFLREVDKFVKESTYSNKTEAFKAGIRKLMDDYYINKEVRRGLGSWKRAGIKEPTPEEFARIREEVGRESLRKAGLL